MLKKVKQQGLWTDILGRRLGGLSKKNEVDKLNKGTV